LPSAESRDRFPVLRRYAYLNAGTCGPMSTRTHQAMAEWEERDLAQGRSGTARREAGLEVRDRLRERLGNLLRVPADGLALTTSTTEGCNIVVTGLRLGPEDEVVTTDAEHPGLLGPLAASGAVVRRARVLDRPAAEAAGAVLAEVTARTRLIALSHVLWLNGHVLPVAEIKRRSGLPLLVDGAQSVGAIPVDATVADYYTVSGQKWLCGPELTGALYVADRSTLRPQLASYQSEAYAGTTAALGVTHHPVGLLAGLLQAVEDLPEGGFERAAAMVARCREALGAAGIEVATEPGQGTLIAFGVAGDPATAVERAAARGVIVRSLPNGWLRASVGWWTDDADVERLVEAFS
jgi:L-cysteine/cystine lyase